MLSNTTIREARLAAGLLQKELAQRAGISEDTLFRIERGLVPSEETMSFLRTALNLALVEAAERALEVRDRLVAA